jgi:hypothetical protein
MNKRWFKKRQIFMRLFIAAEAATFQIEPKGNKTRDGGKVLVVHGTKTEHYKK